MKEREASEAPVWMSAEEASAWAAGFNAAVEEMNSKANEERSEA